MERNP